jgi:hypothetical protein
MHSALHVQSTFLDMSHSTTARHIPCSALELRYAEPTSSALLLETRFQAAPVEQFQENNDIFEKSACQIADGAHDNVPDDTSPDADTEVYLIPTFAHSMKIILCPEVFF